MRRAVRDLVAEPLRNRLALVERVAVRRRDHLLQADNVGGLDLEGLPDRDEPLVPGAERLRC